MIYQNCPFCQTEWEINDDSHWHTRCFNIKNNHHIFLTKNHDSDFFIRILLPAMKTYTFSSLKGITKAIHSENVGLTSNTFMDISNLEINQVIELSKNLLILT